MKTAFVGLNLAIILSSSFAHANTLKLADPKSGVSITVEYESYTDQEGSVRGKLNAISVVSEKREVTSGFVRLPDLFSISERTEYSLTCQGGRECRAEFNGKSFDIQVNPGGGEAPRVTLQHYLNVNLFGPEFGTITNLLPTDPLRSGSPYFLLSF